MTRERLNGVLESNIYQDSGDQYCNGFLLPRTGKDVWYLDMGENLPPYMYKMLPWTGETATEMLMPIGWPTGYAASAYEDIRAGKEVHTSRVTRHRHDTGGILIG